MLAWGKTSQVTLNPFNTLQKKNIRILSNSDYLAHTTPLFKSLSILKFDDIYTLHSLVFMFKTLVLDMYLLVRNEIVTSQPTSRYNTKHTAYVVPLIGIDKCRQKICFQGIRN